MPQHRLINRGEVTCTGTAGSELRKHFQAVYPDIGPTKEHTA